MGEPMPAPYPYLSANVSDAFHAYNASLEYVDKAKALARAAPDLGPDVVHAQNTAFALADRLIFRMRCELEANQLCKMALGKVDG